MGIRIQKEPMKTPLKPLLTDMASNIFKRFSSHSPIKVIYFLQVITLAMDEGTAVLSE